MTTAVELTDPCRIHDGADAGQNRAAEERRLDKWKIVVDLDQRIARHHGIFCKGRHTKVMMDGLAMIVQAGGATQQPACCIGGGARLA